MDEIRRAAPSPMKTKLVIAVKDTSSKYVFQWTLEKIIRSNCSGFEVSFLHIQVPKARSLTGRFFSRILRTKASSDSDRLNEPDKLPDPESGEPAFLADLKRRCEIRGIAYTKLPFLCADDPKEIICRVVNIHSKPDLLIVGDRGLTAFQRLFRTNVFEYCAKHSEYPVIRIKQAYVVTQALED